MPKPYNGAAHGQNSIFDLIRRLPGPVALAIGVFFGIIVGKLLPWSSTVSQCSGYVDDKD